MAERDGNVEEEVDARERESGKRAGCEGVRRWRAEKGRRKKKKKKKNKPNREINKNQQERLTMMLMLMEIGNRNSFQPDWFKVKQKHEGFSNAEQGAVGARNKYPSPIHRPAEINTPLTARQK